MQSPTSAALQALINTVTTAMVTNASITASDVNQIISMYNSWRAHKHTATDLRGQDTFGDAPVYGASTFAASPQSSSGKSTGGVLFPNNGFLNAIADEIDDTDVNSFIASINSIRSHKHTIFDTIS